MLASDTNHSMNEFASLSDRHHSPYHHNPYHPSDSGMAIDAAPTLNQHSAPTYDPTHSNLNLNLTTALDAFCPPHSLPPIESLAASTIGSAGSGTQRLFDTFLSAARPIFHAAGITSPRSLNAPPPSPNLVAAVAAPAPIAPAPKPVASAAPAPAPAPFKREAVAAYAPAYPVPAYTRPVVPSSAPALVFRPSPGALPVLVPANGSATTPVAPVAVTSAASTGSAGSAAPVSGDYSMTKAERDKYFAKRQSRKRKVETANSPPGGVSIATDGGSVAADAVGPWSPASTASTASTQSVSPTASTGVEKEEPETGKKGSRKVKKPSAKAVAAAAALAAAAAEDAEGDEDGDGGDGGDAGGDDCDDDENKVRTPEEERKWKRRKSNRAAAQQSRLRKKRAMADLEAKVAALQAKNDLLIKSLEGLKQENANLRQAHTVSQVMVAQRTAVTAAAGVAGSDQAQQFQFQPFSAAADQSQSQSQSPYPIQFGSTDERQQQQTQAPVQANRGKPMVVKRTVTASAPGSLQQLQLQQQQTRLTGIQPVQTVSQHPFSQQSQSQSQSQSQLSQLQYHMQQPTTQQFQSQPQQPQQQQQQRNALLSAQTHSDQMEVVPTAGATGATASAAATVAAVGSVPFSLQQQSTMIGTSQRLASGGMAVNAQGDSAAVDTNPQQPGANTTISSQHQTQFVTSRQLTQTQTSQHQSQPLQQQQQPQPQHQPVQPVQPSQQRMTKLQRERERQHQSIAGVFFLCLTLSTASLRQAITGTWHLSQTQQTQYQPRLLRPASSTHYQHTTTHTSPPLSPQQHFQSQYQPPSSNRNHSYQRQTAIFKPQSLWTNSKQKRRAPVSIRPVSSSPQHHHTQQQQARTIYMQLRGSRPRPLTTPASVYTNSNSTHTNKSRFSTADSTTGSVGSGGVRSAGPDFVQINVRINLVA